MAVRCCYYAENALSIVDLDLDDDDDDDVLDSYCLTWAFVLVLLLPRSVASTYFSVYVGWTSPINGNKYVQGKWRRQRLKYMIVCVDYISQFELSG